MFIHANIFLKKTNNESFIHTVRQRIYRTNLKELVSNICQIFTPQQNKEFKTFYSIYKNTYANAPRNIWIEKIIGISSGGHHIIFETCTSRTRIAFSVQRWATCLDVLLLLGSLRKSGSWCRDTWYTVLIGPQTFTCTPQACVVIPNGRQSFHPYRLWFLYHTLDSLSMLAMSPFLSVCWLFPWLSRLVLVSWPSCSDSGSPCWLSLLASDQVRGKRARLVMSASSLALQAGVLVSYMSWKLL